MLASTQPYLIGVTGGSGSGKTSFLHQLEQALPVGALTVLSQDHYYVPIDEQPRDDQDIENFDLPESINQEEFVRDIAQLKAGQTVFRKEYTFNNSNAEPRQLEFKAAPIVVVEGIFVFSDPDIFSQLDLKVFIETEDYLMLKRRVIRDASERGYDMDDVLYRFENHVMPAFRQYIEPYKQQANIIIPNSNSYEVGLEVIAGFLKSKL